MLDVFFDFCLSKESKDDSMTEKKTNDRLEDWHRFWLEERESKYIEEQC